MAYDYSVDAPGPIAPLDWVRDEVITGGIEAAGGPEKLVLGIPMYGRNWVVATTGECPDSAIGTQAPRLDAIDELIERRDANPVYDQTTDEWTFTYQLDVTEGDQTCTQTREVHYGDADSVRRRMQLSVDTGLLGVALFAFGYQTDDVFTAIAEIDATLATTIPDDAGTTTAAPLTAAPSTVAPAAVTATTVAPTAGPATTTASTAAVTTTTAA
jgi:spore germination protein YaaH